MRWEFCCGPGSSKICNGEEREGSWYMVYVCGLGRDSIRWLLICVSTVISEMEWWKKLYLEARWPMSVTCRLCSMPLLFILVLFISYCFTFASSTRVYTCQTLLDIGVLASTSGLYHRDRSALGVLCQHLPWAIWASCQVQLSSDLKEALERSEKTSWRPVRRSALTRDRHWSALDNLPRSVDRSVRLSCLHPILPNCLSHLLAFAPSRRLAPASAWVDVLGDSTSPVTADVSSLSPSGFHFQEGWLG